MGCGLAGTPIRGGKGVHSVRMEQSDDRILVTSLANEEGSELSMELTRDGDILTGTWRERTSQAGSYKGRVFHGVLQLALNSEGTKAEGKWLGFNSHRAKINSGDWTLQRQ